MAHPLEHCKSSVKKFGGHILDYQAIHDWFDETKKWIGHSKHRMFRHHSEGIFECERVFGVSFINSDGKSVDVVDIAMLHIAEDFRMKFVPTAQDYLQHIQVQAWFNNGVKELESDEGKEIAKNLIKKLQLT
jgi:hypothetical protein